MLGSDETMGKQLMLQAHPFSVSTESYFMLEAFIIVSRVVNDVCGHSWQRGIAD